MSLCRRLLLTGALLTGVLSSAAAQPAPRLETLEGMVDELSLAGSLATDRPLEVAGFVFAALKERVKVYPTENYYYFRFVDGGTVWAGNFRLDPRDRDNGKIHFAYYEELAEWKPTGPEYYVELDSGSGFSVERVSDLTYRVTHGGKSVVFELNDLSHVTPPAAIVEPKETYIGPIFDESALRFFLFYNQPAKAFLYVLDETQPVPEKFTGSKGVERLLVGRRTGFAFYRDHRHERKILIGVFRRNSVLNTYFDGPFDQLPENFIKGDALRDAIVDSDPRVKGRLDRLGHYPSGSRYAIHPYMLYKTLSALERVDSCASGQRERPSYYRCFVNPPR